VGHIQLRGKKTKALTDSQSSENLGRNFNIGEIGSDGSSF